MAIIYTYPTKQNPEVNDLVLISDVSDGNKTKNATISSLQSSISGVSSINSMTGDIILNAGGNLSVTTTASSGSVTYDLNPAVVISSSLSIPDGTAAQPSLMFVSDVETGIYKTSGGDFGITCGSIPSLTVSNGAVGVPTKLELKSLGDNTNPAIEIDGGSGIYSSENTNTTTSYTVTVVQDAEGNDVYALNGVQQAEIDLIYGQTYTFDWDSTSPTHPFQFVKPLTRDPNKPSGTVFTDGVTVNGTTTTISVSHQGGARIFYGCANHVGMGALINLKNTRNLNFSVNDKEIAAIDGRNNVISGITHLGNGLKFETDGDVLDDYETGMFYPWVEVCNYDQQNAVNNWSSWGGSEDEQWYNQTYASYGYYTKVGNLVTISFRAYPLNQSSERFVCNGIRIKMPFNLSTGAIAKGFTGSLAEGKAQSQGINAGWISGSYLYMMISQVGLSEVAGSANTYENITNNNLTNVWTDSDQITVTGTPGQTGCTTSAALDKFRYPSVYWSTFGRTTRYSFRASSYTTFSFGGSAQVTGTASYS